MILTLQPLQTLARGVVCALRDTLRRHALVGAALLIAALGAGFLVFAAFLGHLSGPGPGLAAMVTGAAALAVARGLLRIARTAGRSRRPGARVADPQECPHTAPPGPADAAIVAVFAAAFLPGRQLADWWDPSSTF